MLPCATRVLTDGCYKGSSALILAGGPSVNTLRDHWLDGRLTIGVNLSFSLNPDMNYVGDLELIKMLERDPLSQWKTFCLRRLQLISDGLRPNLKQGQIKCQYCYEIPRKVRHSQWSETLDDGVGMGNNAGYVALNLAWILGARPIYLLGYDLNGKDGKADHWHEFYEGTDRKTSDREYTQMYKCFRDNVPEAVRPHVVNLNPKSRLDIFQRKHPEEVFG